MGRIDFGRAFSLGWIAFSDNVGVFIGATCLTFVISMTVVLGPAIYAGYYYMALKALRGGRPVINDLFIGFGRFGSYFLGGLLMFILGFAGMLACCVGMFVTNALTFFLLVVMVDQGKGVGEAFDDCRRHFKADWLILVVFSFVLNLVASAGVYMVYIGLLLSMPLAACVKAAAYMEIFRRGGAPMMAIPLPVAEAVNSKETSV